MSAPYPPVDGTQPCAKLDPEIFFSTGKIGRPPAEMHDAEEHIAVALAACAICPFERACLAYALTHDDIVGIWGGTTTQRRRELRRRMQIPRQRGTSHDDEEVPRERYA